MIELYDPITDFSSSFDFDEDVQADDEHVLSTGDEATPEVVTEGELLEDSENAIKAVPSNDTNSSQSILPGKLAETKGESTIALSLLGSNFTDDSSTTMLAETLNVPNAPPAEDKSTFTYVSSDEGERIVLGLNPDNLFMIEIRDELTGELLSSNSIEGLHSIYIKGSDHADDFLTIDFTNSFELAGGIYYDGGDDYFDSLEVIGVSIGSYTPGDVFGDGVIVANNTTINFTGLEPVYIDGSNSDLWK